MNQIPPQGQAADHPELARTCAWATEGTQEVPSRVEHPHTLATLVCDVHASALVSGDAAYQVKRLLKVAIGHTNAQSLCQIDCPNLRDVAARYDLNSGAVTDGVAARCGSRRGI
jgi:hypothetical protein